MEDDNLPPTPVPCSSTTSSRYRHTHQTHKPRSSSKTSSEFSVNTHHMADDAQSTTSTTATPSANGYHHHRHYTRTKGVLETEEFEQQQRQQKYWDACSGKKCRSCSATLVADCVAVSCCPLAVVSFLALAFIKVPYLMGRRCLGGRRKRKKTRSKTKTNDKSRSSASKQKPCGGGCAGNNYSKKNREKSCGGGSKSDVVGRCDDLATNYSKKGKEGGNSTTRDIVFEFGEGKWVGLEMEIKEEARSSSSSLCRGNGIGNGGVGFVEVDNVLLELYQVGHLGFGRLSFTGINHHHHHTQQQQQQQQPPRSE